MIVADTSGWKFIGDTANAKLFEVEPRIVAVDPRIGAHDTVATATTNLEVGSRYLASCGGGIVLVYFDQLAGQEWAARRVYRRYDPAVCFGLGLIGGTPLARAMMSFFLGLARVPNLPTKVFGSAEEAVQWARASIGARSVRAAAAS